MYMDIQLNHHHLEHLDLNTVNSSLDILKEMAPSDGIFTAEGLGISLHDVESQILAGIDAQIKEWRSDRFHMFALPPVSHHFKKVKRALVVDDDADMARFITHQLKREECKVESCADGYDALEKLVSKNYDLVIMDWSLPGINGGEVLRKTDEYIDRDPTTSENWHAEKKSVVIVSGHDINKLHFPLVEKFEIVDFWSKKIGPSALVNKVKNIAHQNLYKS